MKIMTRKQAEALGESKYFTGEVCKNGHLSYRYTSSGTCESCIRGYNGVRSAENSVARAERQEKMIRLTETLSDFVDIKIPCALSDLTTLKNVVTAFAQVRCLDIEASNVWNPIPKHGMLYKVKCHPDDATQIRKYANDLYNVSSPLDTRELESRLKQFDPPPRPFPTVDDIAK
jgi:hypothetical protein